jgi:hypothetical protein
MVKIKIQIIVAACMMLACQVQAGGLPASTEGDTKDLPLLQRWSGDLPVAQIERLPAGQQEERVGYIGDQAAFASLWEVLKPGEPLPEVDFKKNLVIFSRNTVYYNRTSIARVTLKDGAIEVLSMETMTSLPVEDKVAIGLAVIPRDGVALIKTGDKLLPVRQPEAPGEETGIDFDRIIFLSRWTQSGKIQFKNSEYREAAAPGSASEVVVRLTDKRATGVLNGIWTAAVVLATEPGGSGAFYDLALLYNGPEGWVNVDSVLLGDRVKVHDIEINGDEILVNMTVHGQGEGMCCPTVQENKRFAVIDDRLVSAGEKTAVQENK